MRLFAVVVCSALSLPLFAYATANDCTEENIKMLAKSDATAGIDRYKSLVMDFDLCDEMDESYAKEVYDFSYDLTYSQVCHGEEGFKLGKAGLGPNPVCKDYVNAGYYRHRHAQGIERYKQDVIKQAQKEAMAKTN